MRVVNFEKLQAGDLVEVPRTQFAPMRRGWNGWLFSNAVVIRKGIGEKSRKPVVVVEMCTPFGRDEYRTVERVFFAEYVFQTNSVKTAKRFLESDGVTSKEEFEQYVKREDVTGCEWIKFLVDKGFIF